MREILRACRSDVTRQHGYLRSESTRCRRVVSFQRLYSAVPSKYQEILLTAPDKKAKPSLMSSPLEVKKSFRPTSPETAMTVFYYSDVEPKKKWTAEMETRGDVHVVV